MTKPAPLRLVKPVSRDETRPARRSRPLPLSGIGAAPGIAIARALVLQHEEIPIYRMSIGRSQIAAECGRFEAALRVSLRQLQEIKTRISKAVGEEHGYIFDAQLLMLEDPLLVESILSTIKRERVNAEWAVKNALRDLAAIFDDLKDDYLRERKGDVSDVGGRLLLNLAGGRERSLDNLDRDYVLVSDDVQPSDTAQLDWNHITGLAMEAGSRTYHTAIIARSIGMPCVVGVPSLMREVQPGATLILDGNEGVVWLNPDRQLLRDYRERRKHYSALGRELGQLKDLPAETVDGTRILLQANVEFPEETQAATTSGAEGIGLFRSEWFLVKSGGSVPSEEEQYQVYAQLAEGMRPHPVIVRTFDVEAGQLQIGKEAPEPNPVLGLRATRLLLKRKDLLRAQLRALLRARLHGNLKVMFPMISGVEELREARAVVEEAKEELAASGREFGGDMPLGVTIEVPSAAVTADLLAREADFLSIGTNDLIQYCLAVDRSNERVSYLYQPLHPAILRIIKFVVDSGHAAGIRVGICGEIAADPLLVVILLGFGLDELSMNAASIPYVKDFIRKLSAAEARTIAARALELKTAAEVSDWVASQTEARIRQGRNET